MFSAGNRQYKLARIGLVRAACPRELENTQANLSHFRAIVIDANVKGYGRVPKLEFVPPGVIVAGAARRRKLMEMGIVHDYAFVDCSVPEIRCDDEISSSELMDKLRILLNAKILGPNADGAMPGQYSPYIMEVYPFENYFIYSYKGDKYRQLYVLDPIAKTCRLTQGSVKVEEKFVTASVDRMPLVQTGLHYSPAVAPGNDQTMTRGASNSELVTNLIRNWQNVNEAVAMYLSAIRNGQHKPPMAVPAFAPVALGPDNKIRQAVAAQGVDVYDFASWSAAEQSKDPKTKDGLPASSYAYVGDKNDTSTWHLKVHDAAHVKNALARINQVHGIPPEAKPGVLAKVRKLATKHGIGVSAKPSAKQKTWVKKKGAK